MAAATKSLAGGSAISAAPEGRNLIGMIIFAYVLNGAAAAVTRPAIITAWDEATPGTVNAQIFMNGTDVDGDALDNVVWAKGLTYDETASATGTWRWPGQIPPVAPAANAAS